MTEARGRKSAFKYIGPEIGSAGIDEGKPFFDVHTDCDCVDAFEKPLELAESLSFPYCKMAISNKAINQSLNGVISWYCCAINL